MNVPEAPSVLVPSNRHKTQGAINTSHFLLNVPNARNAFQCAFSSTFRALQSGQSPGALSHETFSVTSGLP